jgi:hypothetical protein
MKPEGATDADDIVEQMEFVGDELRIAEFRGTPFQTDILDLSYGQLLPVERRPDPVSDTPAPVLAAFGLRA